MNAPAPESVISHAARAGADANALVILGSTITALAVARDAAAHGLAPSIVDTCDGIAFRTRSADAHLLPNADDVAVVEHLVRLARQTRSLLVATGDVWLRFIMRHRMVLEGDFEAVLHPDNVSLEICLSKVDFARWCRAHALDAPAAWLVGEESRPAELHLPVMIRPAETLHGRESLGLPKAVEARTEAELQTWLERFAGAGIRVLVTESLLAEPVVQYSVPASRSNGRMQTFVARKTRPAPENCSVGTYVELCPHPEVEALARRALDTLDYFGIAEVEVLHVPRTGRSYLIEINARPWLQYALGPASGHDLLGLVTGRPAISPRAERKIGVRWIDFRSDLFACWSRSVGLVRNGKLGLGAYLRSLARANVFALFAWSDLRPWIAHVLREGGGR